MKTYNDFEKIVINKTPLIDVRAPIEFTKGAFENALNLPIMNDNERHLVGTCYKEQGNEAAVKLGHQLVSGEIKKERINAWKDYINANPETMIYCFRGGQRSRIAQEWLKEEAGIKVLRLEGGYKAFRNYLIQQLEPENQSAKPILLGGCTGSGKTILLEKLQNAIDLEGIANHHGSSFGKQITPQPTQINFENNLAYALIRHRHQGYKYMILEDEGRHVGRCFIPKNLATYFNSGGVVILETPLEERVEITMDEYVHKSQANYIEEHGYEEGIGVWAEYIKNSIYKIRKRLGLERTNEVVEIFERAYQRQINHKDSDAHKDWIELLLKEYYDPMYNYQIEQTKDRIIFRGNKEEVEQWFNNSSIIV